MKTQRWIVTLMACGPGLSQISAEATDRDPPQARQAATDENAKAEFQQASACLSGRDCPKDVEKAYKLIESAARKGYPDAIGGMGYFHAKGIVVEKNPEEAEKAFRKGAGMGSVKSQFNLGTILLERTKKMVESNSSAKNQLRKEAMEWIRKAADQKMPEAAIAYGRYHYYGENGVGIDYPTALSYFKSIEDSGKPWVLNMLGTMYMRGQGCEKDLAAAERSFRNAALRGDAKGQANLGRLLDADTAENSRRSEGIAWLMIATDQGDVAARKSLNEAKTAAKPETIEKANELKLELRKKIQTTEAAGV